MVSDARSPIRDCRIWCRSFSSRRVFSRAFFVIARVATFAIVIDSEVALQWLSIASLPLITLPAFALLFVRGETAISIVMVMVLAATVVALARRDAVDAHAVRLVTAY